MSLFWTAPRFCENSKRLTALQCSIQNFNRICRICMLLDSLRCRISDPFLDSPSLVQWPRESLGKLWLKTHSIGQGACALCWLVVLSRARVSIAGRKGAAKASTSRPPHPLLVGSKKHANYRKAKRRTARSAVENAVENVYHR